MIETIEITGNDYKVEEGLRKYTEKRLDRYLPKEAKKGAIIRVVVAQIGKGKTDKYEITATMELTGGKTIVAKDECTNVFAGVDLVEAKLTGQIRRYKLEVQPHRQKRSLKDLFIKRG